MHADPNAADARESFTRDELLQALRLTPCHVTGMHTPDHHLDSTCEMQRAQGFQRVLELIGATEADLPRALHDDCGWCHRVPSQEKYRERLRLTHEWAGVEVSEELAAPAPDHPCFDVSERVVLRAVRKLAKGGEWVNRGALQEELGLGLHTSKLHRPLDRLVENGKLQHKFINNSGHVRPS